MRQDITFTSGRDVCAAWFYMPEGATGDAWFPGIVMAPGFSAVKESGLNAVAERFWYWSSEVGGTAEGSSEECDPMDTYVRFEIRQANHWSMGGRSEDCSRDTGPHCLHRCYPVLYLLPKGGQ